MFDCNSWLHHLHINEPLHSVPASIICPELPKCVHRYGCSCALANTPPHAACPQAVSGCLLCQATAALGCRQCQIGYALNATGGCTGLPTVILRVEINKLTP